MAKVDGYYHILGAGGVTKNAAGETVPATTDNIDRHFPQPLPYEEPTFEADFDGDGVKETITIRPAEMPILTVPDDPMFRDDGFSMTPPDPAESPQFQKCKEYAEQNGLTAVLVRPRQDVGADGRLSGSSTMRWDEPRVIYLDQDGNVVKPDNAPGYGLFAGIDFSPDDTAPDTKTFNVENGVLKCDPAGYLDLLSEAEKAQIEDLIEKHGPITVETSTLDVGVNASTTTWEIKTEDGTVIGKSHIDDNHYGGLGAASRNGLQEALDDAKNYATIIPPKVSPIPDENPKLVDGKETFKIVCHADGSITDLDGNEIDKMDDPGLRDAIKHAQDIADATGAPMTVSVVEQNLGDSEIALADKIIIEGPNGEIDHDFTMDSGIDIAQLPSFITPVNLEPAWIQFDPADQRLADWSGQLNPAYLSVSIDTTDVDMIAYNGKWTPITGESIDFESNNNLDNTADFKLT